MGFFRGLLRRRGRSPGGNPNNPHQTNNSHQINNPHQSSVNPSCIPMFGLAEGQGSEAATPPARVSSHNPLYTVATSDMYAGRPFERTGLPHNQTVVRQPNAVEPSSQHPSDAHGTTEDDNDENLSSSKRFEKTERDMQKKDKGKQKKDDDVDIFTRRLMGNPSEDTPTYRDELDRRQSARFENLVVAPGAGASINEPLTACTPECSESGRATEDVPRSNSRRSRRWAQRLIPRSLSTRRANREGPPSAWLRGRARRVLNRLGLRTGSAIWSSESSFAGAGSVNPNITQSLPGSPGFLPRAAGRDGTSEEGHGFAARRVGTSSLYSRAEFRSVPNQLAQFWENPRTPPPIPQRSDRRRLSDSHRNLEAQTTSVTQEDAEGPPHETRREGASPQETDDEQYDGEEYYSDSGLLQTFFQRTRTQPAPGDAETPRPENSDSESAKDVFSTPAETPTQIPFSPEELSPSRRRALEFTSRHRPLLLPTIYSPQASSPASANNPFATNTSRPLGYDPTSLHFPNFSWTHEDPGRSTPGAESPDPAIATALAVLYSQAAQASSSLGSRAPSAPDSFTQERRSSDPAIWETLTLLSNQATQATSSPRSTGSLAAVSNPSATSFHQATHASSSPRSVASALPHSFTPGELWADLAYSNSVDGAPNQATQASSSPRLAASSAPAEAVSHLSFAARLTAALHGPQASYNPNYSPIHSESGEVQRSQESAARPFQASETNFIMERSGRSFEGGVPLSNNTSPANPPASSGASSSNVAQAGSSRSSGRDFDVFMVREPEQTSKLSTLSYLNIPRKLSYRSSRNQNKENDILRPTSKIPEEAKFQPPADDETKELLKEIIQRQKAMESGLSELRAAVEMMAPEVQQLSQAMIQLKSYIANWTRSHNSTQREIKRHIAVLAWFLSHPSHALSQAFLSGANLNDGDWVMDDVVEAELAMNATGITAAANGMTATNATNAMNAAAAMNATAATNVTAPTIANAAGPQVEDDVGAADFEDRVIQAVNEMLAPGYDNEPRP